ncbi:MAG TPA: hypothetical protein VF974_04875 [Patescibacteria group bacterium]
MKLISPKEVNTQNQIAKTAVVEELAHYQSLLKGARETYEELKERIDPIKEKLEKDFLIFVNMIQLKRSKLLKELNELENELEKRKRILYK